MERHFLILVPATRIPAVDSSGGPIRLGKPVHGISSGKIACRAEAPEIGRQVRVAIAIQVATVLASTFHPGNAPDDRMLRHQTAGHPAAGSMS
ncbi:hypothetical protein NT2_39_00010 [Caenibius tardaugens NBRC 16725]|uniref:Uncharacterized protein n=1 Tax=Caenibius tardaugens NBRC 16725 TaxID=1219035 RepID=U2YR80_9SPHN|nr:hypothetical protein NT2_39_00010 [Caenibius tardaugens NBRC 16725]